MPSSPDGAVSVKDESRETGVRILIADDHTFIREGLKRTLVGTMEGWEVDEASDGFQALESLRRTPFRLVITDLSMPGMNGLDLIKRIRSEFPDVGVLVLSMHDEQQYAIRAFKAGAHGYMTKAGAATELVNAVRKVMAGGAYVPPDLAESVVLQLTGGARTPNHTDLTDREFDVLRRLVVGQRPAEIAEALHLSVKTVSSHKTRIQEKLQLPSTAALIRYGLDQGLGADGALGRDGRDVRDHH